MRLPRRLPLLSLFTLFGLLFGAPAHTEPEARELYVVPLKAELAERLLPLLKPVMSPGMAITGTGNQLIVRATPSEHAELLSLLEGLDRPPERLLIQLGVRRGIRGGRTGHIVDGRIEQSERDGLRVQGGAQIYSTRELDDAEILQSIQTIAGQVAHIGVGQAIPLTWLGWFASPTGPTYAAGVEPLTVETGFYALARIVGQDVEVALAQQRESLSPDGNLAINRAATELTVRGPLGTWIAIGGSASQDQHRVDGIARIHSTRDQRSTEETLRLRVDRLP